VSISRPGNAADDGCRAGIGGEPDAAPVLRISEATNKTQPLRVFAKTGALPGRQTSRTKCHARRGLVGCWARVSQKPEKTDSTCSNPSGINR